MIAFSHFIFKNLFCGHKEFSLLVSHEFFNLQIFLYEDKPCMFSFYINFLLQIKVLNYISMISSRLRLKSIAPKKLLILNVNVLCYIAHFPIQNGNERIFGKNIDKRKVEVKARIKNFLSNAFNCFYIAIQFCMKLGCARRFSHVYF